MRINPNIVIVTESGNIKSLDCFSADEQGYKEAKDFFKMKCTDYSAIFEDKSIEEKEEISMHGIYIVPHAETMIELYKSDWSDNTIVVDLYFV